MQIAGGEWIEGIRVVHADACMLVLDKPAGLLCVPGRGDDKQDCLSTRVQRAYADALVVHRLDMATSGLCAMARGIDAQRALSRAFETRAVAKQYVAVVDGQLDGSGEIDLPLRSDWPNRPRQMVDPAQGRASRTRWRALAHDAQAHTTRVALEPVTGRSHQLRVHMLAIGHPIVGDTLYAAASVAARAARLLLHASKLELPHPVTGERVPLESPVPF